jgi:hypothetical protein
MKSTTTLYDQQRDDFLSRARKRLGELSLRQFCEEGCSSCEARRALDLWVAVRTIQNCHTRLTHAEQQRLMDAVTSRYLLGAITPLPCTRGIVVKEAGPVNGSTPGISLPLTGDQVMVQAEGSTSTLQTVITTLYNRQSPVYTVCGGGVLAYFHPSVS